MPLPKVWTAYDRLDSADINADMAYLDATRYGELAYGQTVAPVTINTTTEATAVALATAPPVTLDGATVVDVEFSCAQIGTPAIAAAATLVCLFLDGVSLGRWATVQTGTASASPFSIPLLLRYRLTPAAGVHTFSVRAYCSGGTATVQAGPGGTGSMLPMWIRVRRP